MRTIYKLRSPSKDGEFPGSERMVCHYFSDRICANELRVKKTAKMLLQQVLLLDLRQSSILKQLASCQFCSPQVCSFIPRSSVFKHRHTGSGACNQFIILVGGAKSFLAPKRNLTGFWFFFMNVFIPFTLYKPELAVYDSSVFLKSKMEQKLG